MRLFGIRPYRRHGKKYGKRKVKRTFPNLLFEVMPSYPNHVRVTDFTELIFHGQKVYVSTILDLFTRQLMDVQIAVRKGAALTVATLAHALFNHPKPVILHSDNGSEYTATAYLDLLEASRSRDQRPAVPGRTNTKSFYDKFKIDFGDPNRFASLGELVAEVYRTMWEYNHERIHSALTPRKWAESSGRDITGRMEWSPEIVFRQASKSCAQSLCP